MKAATFLLAGCVVLLAGCSSNSDNEPPQQATSAHVPKVMMSQLAASACASAGGTLALSHQLDGSAVGMCQLANGRRCGENALASGTCAR